MCVYYSNDNQALDVNVFDNEDADLKMKQALFPSSLDENLHQLFGKSPQTGAIDADKNMHQLF